MHAVQIRAGGALAWGEVATPNPGPGQVRIAVHATSVNRADLAQRAGTYPPPPGASEILGLEAAGVVDAVGDDVAWPAVGDRVAALLTGGGYAEQVIAHAGHCLPMHDGMTFEEAASLPEILTTAWLNLAIEADLRYTQRVLLHAGASGVGTAAIQICRWLGCPAWVVVGSDAKLAACRKLGAQGGAVRTRERFVDLVPKWTRKQGFDVILDPVGAATLDDDLRSLATGGRLVVIGLLSGRTAELDLGRLMVKRLRIVGSVLRSRTDEEKVPIVASVRYGAWDQLPTGVIRPVIDRVLPITDVAAAHDLVASNETIGKVVLRVR